MVRQHEIQQVHICFRQKNGIEPLTETTVYPDTIWRERKRNGEIKKEGRRGKKERERQFYILQSTFCRQPNISLRPPSGDRL